MPFAGKILGMCIQHPTLRLRHGESLAIHFPASFSSPKNKSDTRTKGCSLFLHILFLEIDTARLQQTHQLMVHFVVDSLC